MIFYQQNFFSLKCSPFYWEYGTENRFGVHTPVSSVQRFKNALLRIFHHPMQMHITQILHQ